MFCFGFVVRSALINFFLVSLFCEKGLLLMFCSIGVFNVILISIVFIVCEWVYIVFLYEYDWIVVLVGLFTSR